MSKPTYAELYAALTRIADPDDRCHCGAGGPWQTLAQKVLFGREIGHDEFHTESGVLTIEQMLELQGRRDA